MDDDDDDDGDAEIPRIKKHESCLSARAMIVGEFHEMPQLPRQSKACKLTARILTRYTRVQRDVGLLRRRHIIIILTRAILSKYRRCCRRRDSRNSRVSSRVYLYVFTFAVRAAQWETLLYDDI